MPAKPKTAAKAKHAATETQPAAEPETVTSIKGFDPDFRCRGYQYEVGKTYENKGEVVACQTGFHACSNPWDVLSYYGFVADDGRFNRFAEVTQSGKLARHAQDSKIASATITITAELSLPDFVRRGIDWLIEATKPSKVAATPDLNDAGGYAAQIGSSGDGARIGSSGNAARIGSSGNGARIGSSGYDAQIGSSGYDAQIGSSGYAAQIGSSGYAAQIGSSGYGAQIGSSGYGARIGSSGNAAQIGSSGYGAQIGSSGDGAQINSEGDNAVIACAGSVVRFRVGPGGCIAIPWHDGTRTRFTALYEGEQIKAGVWYMLRDGEPVED